MTSMDIRELRQLSTEALEAKLRETRNTLQKSRFAVGQKQLKNIRSIRADRALVAQILTVLRERKTAEARQAI